MYGRTYPNNRVALHKKVFKIIKAITTNIISNISIIQHCIKDNYNKKNESFL